MTTEEKAMALVREEPGCEEWQLIDGMLIPITALCRAIEAHEADKKAFSDAAERTIGAVAAHSHDAEATALHYLSPFILPEPVHPLVQAAADLDLFWNTDMGGRLESALAARGYKIERIEQ